MDDIFWWHSVDLGDEVTPGHKSPELLEHEWANLHLPDLAGRSVLDVGCWDGWFSFRAEERGAARVVALDHYVWSLDLPRQQAYWRDCRDPRSHARAVPRPTRALAPRHVAGQGGLRPRAREAAQQGRTGRRRPDDDRSRRARRVRRRPLPRRPLPRRGTAHRAAARPPRGADRSRSSRPRRSRSRARPVRSSSSHPARRSTPTSATGGSRPPKACTACVGPAGFREVETVAGPPGGVERYRLVVHARVAAHRIVVTSGQVGAATDGLLEREERPRLRERDRS